MNGESDDRGMISELASNGREVKRRIRRLLDIPVDKELCPQNPKVFAFSGNRSGNGRFHTARFTRKPQKAVSMF